MVASVALTVCSSPEYTTPEGLSSVESSAALRPPAFATVDDFRAETPEGWPEVVEEIDAILTAATLASNVCDRPNSEVVDGGFTKQCQNASFKMLDADRELQKAITCATNPGES
ncbi:hypothetical protein G419_14016 [Rhodococcus triatomae BKS 15-14]|nr:hypothetical protein G419_14016 [Rhodococcus triatomae BKS 15-14]